MIKKLYLIGMCVVACMAAGCAVKSDNNREEVENNLQTMQTESTKAEKQTGKINKEQTEVQGMIGDGVIEKLTFEKKLFPGVKDKRKLPEDASKCPLHIVDFKQEGDYLYIADCAGSLYAFQWKKETLEMLLQNEEHPYTIMRDLKGKLYVTDNQENQTKVVYCLQEGNLEEIAKIDSYYTVITMDNDYLYVQKSEGEEMKQIKINTPDKIVNGTNPIVQNLSAFFEKYDTEDYSVHRWEYENESWYVHLVNWKEDRDELYKIDKTGKSEMVVYSTHIAWAGVRQDRVYVSVEDKEDTQNSDNADSSDKASGEKLYCIDETGNKELYLNLSKIKALEENGFQVDMGEFNKDGFTILSFGPSSQLILYSEKENKMILLSEWEKQ